MLGPCTVAAFLDNYFGRSFLHVPGSPEKFSALLPLAAIDSMLADRNPALQVHRAGETYASSAVVIERVDEIHEPVAVLSRHLECALEASIRAKLHVLSNHAPVRRLEQDEIILQVAGESGCTVHGNAGELGDQPPVWEGPLKIGDALYIPRGWWLEPASRGQQSVQLSFVIENPTGADLLDWLAGQVKQHQAFRTDIPRFADPATRADYVTGLRKILARALRAPGLLERYRYEVNAKAPARPQSGLPWSPAASAGHLIAILTPRHVRIRRADNETIFFASNGRRVTLPQEAAPLLQYLCDKSPVSISDFYRSFEGEFDREELADFLSALSRDGIIGLREPDSI